MPTDPERTSSSARNDQTSRKDYPTSTPDSKSKTDRGATYHCDICLAEPTALGEQMSYNIIRVSPRKTKRISVVFTWDVTEGQRLYRAWSEFYND